MSFNIVPATEYQRIFLTDQPMMDCRAPIEFEKGAFTSSVNLPLMMDSERQKVGTCYKEMGQQAALELGHALVHGVKKQQRIDDWLSFISKQSNTFLYCFRGGLRSQISQTWIKEAGCDIPFVEGGYKGMRQYLMDVIDSAAAQEKMLILSGITGSGKTDFLLKRNEAIDLEGIANHRGSSFGKKHEPQPSQINFENNLAVDLLKFQQKQNPFLLLEDESFLIGRSAIPKTFYETMQQSKMLVLEETLDSRLKRLLNEYVHFMYNGYVTRLGDEAGFKAFTLYLQQSISAIKKRLGGQRHDEFQALITKALQSQIQRNDTSDHLEWISLLLTEYYDPMYEYQLNKRQDRIIFKGSHTEMHEWLNQHQN